MKTILESLNNGKAGEQQPLLQKCPIQFSSSSFESQNPSSVSTMNVSQQSMPHLIAVNNLSESWKNNLYNQQQHVERASNLAKDTTCLGLFADVGHFGVILLKDQTIRLCQQNAGMPKDQQNYVPQKAIAVVTPLTQQVVEGVTLSKNVNKKETSLDTRLVPNKTDQHHILHNLQPTNEIGAETNDNTSQTKESPSPSDIEMQHCVKDAGPDENNKLSGQSERLSSFSLNNVSIERKEGAQPSTDGDHPSVKILGENDAGVIGRNSVGMETGMDNLSSIPVIEWTLQRLHTLVTVLEQKQNGQQKDMPFTDLCTEILKLYWNGDHKKLCSAARSAMYVNTMKEVRLYCGTKNSVILQAVSKERLNETESCFHILEHGIAPPKMVFTSSWLNLSENLDINQEHDYGSSKPETPDKELPKKELDKMQESINEIIKSSIKAQTGGEEQDRPLPTEHHMNLRDQIGENTVIDVKNTCSAKKTEGQDSMTVNNVLMESVPSDKTNTSKGKNEAPLQVSLSKQSSEVSDGWIKPGNLLKPLSVDITPVVEKNAIADCISVKVNILPQEKAQRSFIGERDIQKEVCSIQKEDAQILNNSKGQANAELFDKDNKHMDAEIKSDKKSNKMNISCQVDTFCCLAKWFQALGYKNGGLCKCEMNADAVTSAIGVNGVNAAKHSCLLNKAGQRTDMDNCELRNNRKPKNRFGKKSVLSSFDDDASSMDELEIVDVITNYEDVLKLANSMSKHLIDKPVKTCNSHESTKGKTRCRFHHEEITMPEIKTGDKQINLALFGTSHLKQKKKNISLFTSSDKVPSPPKTINIKICSNGNKHPNTTKRQTPKQEVWNSWKKTYVPLKSSTYRRSKKLKRAKAPESIHAADNSVIKTTAFDLITTLLSPEDSAQNRPEAKNGNALSLASADKKKKTATNQSKKRIPRSRKIISSTRKDKIRKLKLNFKWDSANNTSKLVKTSYDPDQPNGTSKNKLNTGVALNFGVLPASFNISDGSSSMEANQSVSVDSGSKDQSVLQIKRKLGISGAWCGSPRKKQCLKRTPSPPNTSGLSTFQEFKKKYEQKKQKISV